MKVQSLVKITTSGDGGTHLTFFRPPLSLPYAARNRTHALEIARKFCSDVALFEGRELVARWSSSGGQTNCPEGAVRLPADVWVCKLSGRMCPLQASISLDREPEFFMTCHAPTKKKEQIFGLLQSGRYLGFHHVPGRYLCVACEAKGGKKRSYFYHYPFELAELDVALHLSYEDALAIVSTAQIPRSRVMSPLCASCCRETAIKLKPALTEDLVVMELDVDLRPV